MVAVDKTSEKFYNGITYYKSYKTFEKIEELFIVDVENEYEVLTNELKKKTKKKR
ncbi:MAG: hypothetical protein ACK5K7_07525 [Bacilli bacterium]